jgi:signal transduction histidine kinase
MAAPGGTSQAVPLPAYVVVFLAAAAACLWSVRRARRIEDPETRRGLVWLLVLSGGWSLATVGFLVAPWRLARLAFHQAGLVVGLATVGPWLYFCSAYTGRSLHRDQRVRRLALVVYLGFVALKLTNPIHGLYFEATLVSEPFEHLAITHLTPHWIAMGLSYALASVGYFMLLELFVNVDYDARPLAVLAGLTALPLAFDLLGRSTPWLVEVTYEPLGVAAFAVGVLFVYFEQFQTITLASDVDDPVVVLDEDDEIRDANPKVRGLFPALEGARGEPLSAVVPELAAALDADEADGAVLPLDVDGERRYYLVSPSPFEAGGAQVGRLVVVTDVTETERYRRQLEEKTERLEQFASVVAHDLRNPLNVAQGQLGIAREDGDSDALAVVDESLQDMEALIDDMLALAREGRTVETKEAVSLSAAVERTRGSVDTADATVAVDGDLDVLADPGRLEQLLGNLLRNAVEHGGDDVALTVGALADGDGFYVADDGPGIPEEDREAVLEAGVTTDPGGTGFGLAIVTDIAEAHGWTVTVTESDAGGARFEFAGVEAP